MNDEPDFNLYHTNEKYNKSDKDNDEILDKCLEMQDILLNVITQMKEHTIKIDELDKKIDDSYQNNRKQNIEPTVNDISNVQQNVIEPTVNDISNIKKNVIEKNIKNNNKIKKIKKNKKIYKKKSLKKKKQIGGKTDNNISKLVDNIYNYFS